MTIETLVTVMPPPAAPFEAYRGPWEPVEAALGTSLPQGHNDFVRLYGSGEFMGFPGIHIPRSRSQYIRLVSEAHVVATIFHQLGENPPYSLWPEPDGLLLFGKTDFGDYLFWLCRGGPEEWRVVVSDRDFGDYEVFECDLTGLRALRRGRSSRRDFPRNCCPATTCSARTPSVTTACSD